MDGNASSSSGSKKISFAELVAKPRETLYDLNAGLRTRRTLEQLCIYMAPLQRGKITRKYQLVFRHIIQAIYDLNKENITNGYLRSVDVMTGGCDEEHTTAWLIDPPHTNNLAAGDYITNFISLVKTIIGINDPQLQEDSELTHFLKMAESAKMAGDRGFRLKQLRFHPFLLSSTDRSQFLLNTLVHLKLEQPFFKSWTSAFRIEIDRLVPVRSIVQNLDYFSGVYDYKDIKYEENALGAYLYSRNVLAHLNDEIKFQFFNKNKAIDNGEIPRRLQRLLMDQEQIVEKLTSFFPHMLVDVHQFLVSMGIEVP